MPSTRGRRASDLRFACASVGACIALAGWPAFAQTSASEPVTAVPVAREAARIGTLGVEQQAQWLAKTAASGALAALDDAQLVDLFRSLDPQTLARYLQDGLSDYASCEFTMRRRERIKGK